MLPAFLLPLLGGAAAGMGIGALTDEEGFSGDGWWQGLLGGGALGGLGGAAGLFSPAASGGAAGGLLSPGGSAAALPSSPLVSGAAMPVTDYSIFTGATPGASPLSSIMGATPSTLWKSPTLLSSAEALNPSMLTSAGGFNPNFFSGSGLSNTFGGMMPSQDTLMKGLLGSMVLKNMGPGKSQAQPTPKITRGQRAAPFQPRQPIMFGGDRPQRRSFRRG